MSNFVAPLHSSCQVSKAAPRPLRIALLGYRSHPHVGGQGIYLHYLSKALRARGHSVDVISGPPYPDLGEGINLIRLPSLDLYAHPNPHRALQWRHLKSWADVYEWWGKLSGGFAEPYCFGRRVYRYFKTQRPAYDLVHDNQCLAYGTAAIQRLGYPLVTTIHHPITQDRALAVAAARSKGHQWLVKRWYSFIDMQLAVVKNLKHLVTVSEQSKQDIAQDFKIPAEQVTVIGNGVDTQVFKPLASHPEITGRILTTASSSQPLKGLSVLLEALHSLRARLPHLHLQVIGKCEEGGPIAQQLDRLNLRDCVSFTSGISTEQLVEYYAAAELAVVPSLYEGFGLPVAEALACGKALITTDGGALPEVAGDSALIVKAGDSAALAGAIEQLMTNAAERNALAEKARARSLNQLSWDCVAAKLENYYYAVLAAAKSD